MRETGTAGVAVALDMARRTGEDAPSGGRVVTTQQTVKDDMSDKPDKPYYGTVIRSVRVADDLWKDAQRVAKARNESVTEVIVQALQRYVKRHDKDASQD